MALLSAIDLRALPLFFGPRLAEGRALFGWFHPAPEGTTPRRAVVVCPPLGYEGICAYPTLRTFAERVAAAGIPVLRFDYDGTGDSSGADEDPGRLRAWKDSIAAAIDEVRALAGVTEVALFGVRTGATLAALAAAENAEGGSVDRLVLWNACTSGRAYLREQRAFRLLAEQTGELQARPKAEGDAGDESGGFAFTAETVKDLQEINLLKLGKRPAPKVLVVARDDVPSDDRLTDALAALGADTSLRPMAGYGEMMVAPHKAVYPEAIGEAVIAWLAEPPRGDAAKTPTPAPAPTRTAVARALVEPPAIGVHEEGIRFGAGNAWFGVLTTPAGGARADGAGRRRPLLVFTNTAGNHRVGPNRMYVRMARALAREGFASVRVDLSGVGDGAIHGDAARNHPYGDQLLADVRSLLADLAARGHGQTFGVIGLCSGAFVAYHAALALPAVTSIVLVNLQVFAWEAGMSLEVNPLTRRDRAAYYKSRAFSKETWAKLLHGEVNVPRALRDVSGTVVDRVRGKVVKALAKLPNAASRGSEVARSFAALSARAVDTLFVFSAGDPGIDNLNEKVGASMSDLLGRPNFTVTTIDGVDHSYTPRWSQTELESRIVRHLVSRF